MQGIEGRAVNISGAAPIRLETQTHDVGIIIPPPDIRAIVVRHNIVTRRRDQRALSSVLPFPTIRFPPPWIRSRVLSAAGASEARARGPSLPRADW